MMGELSPLLGYMRNYAPLNRNYGVRWLANSDGQDLQRLTSYSSFAILKTKWKGGCSDGDGESQRKNGLGRMICAGGECSIHPNAL